MKCTINHGSVEIRRLVKDLEHSWTNVYGNQVDVSQASRAAWCIEDMSSVDVSRVWHYLVHHLEEFLTVLPQEMRFGFRGLAHGVCGPWIGSSS